MIDSIFLFMTLKVTLDSYEPAWETAALSLSLSLSLSAWMTGSQVMYLP